MLHLSSLGVLGPINWSKHIDETNQLEAFPSPYYLGQTHQSRSISLTLVFAITKLYLPVISDTAVYQLYSDYDPRNLRIRVNTANHVPRKCHIMSFLYEALSAEVGVVPLSCDGL